MCILIERNLLDHDNFFAGRLFGELNSSVRAHIDDGLLTMSIHVPDEIYHIEPSWRLLPHISNQTMVAYKTSDVKLNWRDHGSTDHNTGGAPMTCGYIKEGAELEKDDEEESENHNRIKRQADQYEYTPTKTRCPLLLVADYRFFQEMGGGNTKTTINYLVGIYYYIAKNKLLYFVINYVLQELSKYSLLSEEVRRKSKCI